MITKYFCEHCNKEFSKPEDCLEHEKTHAAKLDAIHIGRTEERPCKCMILDEADDYQISFSLVYEEMGKTREYTYRLSKNDVRIEVIPKEESTTPPES